MGDSMAGSAWTAVARLTGMGKAIVIGAVLGATYLGNTYQALNALPNLVYYQLLAGSLFASLLVPPLVRLVDEHDELGAKRLVKGFLGSLLLVALAASVILLALGPLILRLLTLGVSDPAVASAQSRVGWLLLVMFVPQIALYVIAGVGAATMNAHGRFALAAAAPALESAGMITVLVIVALVFGTGTSILDVSNAQLMLLGLGTTAAVGLHATFQWLGARRSGPALVPAFGWKDPEVRAVLRRILPTLGFTGLAALQIFSVSIVANRVPGGLVAFQLALNFFYLPTAVVTWPMARAVLPQLSRSHHAADHDRFHDDFVRTIAVASFVTIPIAVCYLVLAPTIASAVAIGQLANPRGITMMAVSLAMLAPAVVGETWFILGTYALYARQDVRSPVRSMAIRVAVSLALMTVAWTAHGTAVLALLGLAISVGSLAGAADIAWRLRDGWRHRDGALLRSLARTMTASIALGITAYLTTRVLGGAAHGHVGHCLEVAAAVAVGSVAFLGVQKLLGAPEIQWLKAGVGRGRPRAGSGGRAA
jgi:putative peptidoglycan lipid II flippase